jgi:hypothetical protein
MKKLLSSLVACFAIVLFVAQLANAQVIYSDGFSRVTGSGDLNGDPNGPAANFSDWGTNDTR